MSKSDQQQKKRKSSQVCDYRYSGKTLDIVLYQVGCNLSFKRAKDLSAAILNERLTSVMERVFYKCLHL